MGRFYGGFLIWDELEKICGRKMCENAKIPHFWAKTRKWYRYQRSGTGTTTSNSFFLTYFCTVKSRIRIPMFRDPKKRIMGVQIRIELSEKRTVPRRLGEFVFRQT